ncbi:MAG: ribose-5-phosphate isomerase RpiA [Acidisphaera sp.]|nr:ribose-5-phosphate isomerase RpiA [Acidisphaera sp.]
MQEADRESLKRQAAEAAVAEVRDGMAVGLGTGSTAAYAIEALTGRVREGLRIVAIPTSERSAAQARAGGIPLTDFAGHTLLDLTIDGADQVERGTLSLIKGMGGALLREKIVAAASARLLIVVDAAKLADRLSLPVPVEVVPFGWQATARRIEALGGRSVRRLEPSGAPYVTDGGNTILDCDFGAIAAPPALERQLRDIVGVIETGLFIGRASAVLAAGAQGIERLPRLPPPVVRPAVLALMGVSGCGKTTVGQALADRLGWQFLEGDDLHPPANVAKMHAGVPLDDADRLPWLQKIAAWVGARLASGEPGIFTCSLLKRMYRDIVIGDRPGVRLLYLHADKAVLAERMARRRGHFMPASLLDSQLATLEEPGAEENPLRVDVSGGVEHSVDATLHLLEQA